MLGGRRSAHGVFLEGGRGRTYEGDGAVSAFPFLLEVQTGSLQFEFGGVETLFELGELIAVGRGVDIGGGELPEPFHFLAHGGKLTLLGFHSGECVFGGLIGATTLLLKRVLLAGQHLFFSGEPVDSLFGCAGEGNHLSEEAAAVLEQLTEGIHLLPEFQFTG